MQLTLSGDAREKLFDVSVSAKADEIIRKLTEQEVDDGSSAHQRFEVADHLYPMSAFTHGQTKTIEYPKSKLKVKDAVQKSGSGEIIFSLLPKMQKKWSHRK